MGLVAVGLDDEPAGAPEEVHLVAGNDRVDLGARDAVRVAAVAHERLEVGACERRLVVNGGEDRRQRGATRTPQVCRDDVVHRMKVEQPQRE